MPFCPICGTKVGEGAGFCPKCLRRLMKGQAPQAKSKKKLVGIIVACAIVISAVIVLITYLPKVPSGSVAELEYVARSAYDFAEELFGPELTSLQRDDLWQNYVGKRVQWTNELRDLSLKKEELSAHFINPLDCARTEIVAVFDEGQRLNLDNLKRGDLVTYTGVLDSFGVAEISLTDCTVVSLPIEPLWWNGDIDTHNKRIIVGDDVLCLGPSTYDDATEYRPRPAPIISTVDRETGDLQWESEKTESILVGIDSQHVYAWHLAQLVPRSEPGDPYYWYASDITALNITSGQIGWYSFLAEDVDCRGRDDCLPEEWLQSDFVDCYILGQGVKRQTSNNGESGLNFLVDKPLLSELTYECQGVIYKITCAVYTGARIECGALQAHDRQTSEVLWMMTFQESGVTDFSIVDGILYVSTDKGVGAFRL